MAPIRSSRAQNAGLSNVIDLTFSPPSLDKKPPSRHGQETAIAAAVQSAKDNGGIIGRSEMQAAIATGMCEPKIRWAVHDAICGSTTIICNRKLATLYVDPDDDDDDESVVQLFQDMDINHTKSDSLAKQSRRNFIGCADKDDDRKQVARPDPEAKENAKRKENGLPRLSEDQRLAERLQQEEAQQLDRDKELQEQAMLKHHDGKAIKFVQNVQDLCKKLSSSGASQIDPLATDDMVWTTKRLLEAQEEFRAAGKPTTVEISYHYTEEKNVASIKTELGLLSRREREENKVKSTFNGSRYGDGIYVAPDVSSFHGERYGKECLMVAVLKGVASRYPVGTEYTTGNDTIVVPRDPNDENSDEWFCVLQHSRQCIPLLHFPDTMVAKYIPGDPRNILVRNQHILLQKVIDDFFNESVATKLRPSYQLGPVVHEYIAPESLDVSFPEVAEYVSYDTLTTQSRTDECPICLDPLMDWQHGSIFQLKTCHHKFHSSCLIQTLQRRRACPYCRQSAVEPRGTMPSGTMTVKTSCATMCSGSDPAGSIVIDYNLPSGIQRPYHPRPTKPYTGTTQTAYIPESADGRKLLKRLVYAFSRGLTFSVGTALPTGHADSVIWASIHHKTSTKNGPHGFPDPNYLAYCSAGLDAAGVPPADQLP